MSRTVLRRLHVGASVTALITITSFLAATVISETTGDEAVVASVKFVIARTVVCLVVAMVAAAVSGRRLGRSRSPLIRRKLRRMQVVAVVGTLVLVPCAIALDQLAARGQFGTAFAILQSIELTGGAVNLTLLLLNLRDGMALMVQRRSAHTRYRVPALGHGR